MKILFLHPNFPAQFKHTAEFAAEQGNEVKFLCQTHYGRKIKGVERITLKNAAGKEALDKKKLPVFERAQELALQYRLGLENIREMRWQPDVVISHSGWGCGLFVKEIWPNTRFICYSEWWFDTESDFFNYDQFNSDLCISSKSVPKAWVRNQHMALELAVADKIVAPTLWQKKQLPQTLRSNCDVIFDGLNSSIFTNEKVAERKNYIVTYGTRGMDPMRCFPQFIRLIPKILKQAPHLKFEIAGRNESFYGLSKPSNSNHNDWHSWACDFLKTNKVDDAVTWHGHLDLTDYVAWLKSSGCHVYLTHPFVTSWSLVEAYCLGSPLVVSDLEATREICQEKEGVWFADHRDENSVAQAIISCTNHCDDQEISKQITRRHNFRFSRSLSNELWRRLWLV